MSNADYQLLLEYVAEQMVPEIFPASAVTRIGVFSFAYSNPNGDTPENRFRVVYDISATPADGNRTALQQAVREDTKPRTTTGTATRRALQEANDALDDDALAQDGSQRIVILFTDGVPFPTGDGDDAQGVCLNSNRDVVNPLLSLDSIDSLLVVALEGFNQGPIRCLIEPGGTNLFTRSFADIAEITEAVQTEICS